MAQADQHFLSDVDAISSKLPACNIAAGIFGYCIREGVMTSFKPTIGYLRDIEQMPNFAPPDVDKFVALYIASNIGRTISSS
ncbi:hypothetical protein [Parasphingorhabdus halotolerans]|nr:hypothetical protein [Parasphingorhabdus halotolerans]